MKTFNIIGLAAIALLTSCDQEKITMNTRINSDGTCQREIIFHADSASLVNPAEASGTMVNGVLEQEAWNKTWSYKNDSLSGQYPMTAEQYHAVKEEHNRDTSCYHSVNQEIWVKGKRTFQSVEEMAENLPLFKDGKQLKAKAQLEKNFRWFYTDFVYTETYEGIEPEFAIPLSRFMADQEASYLLTGTPDLNAGLTTMEAKADLDKLEKKFLKFIDCNLLHDQIQLISEHYDQFPDAPFSLEEFKKIGEEILANDKDLEAFLEVNAEDMLTVILKAYAPGKKIDVYDKAVESNPEIKALWEQRLSLYYYLYNFDVEYNLVMPGTIDLSGCSFCSYHDGVLTYHLNGLRLLTPQYTIQAASRERNLWAIIVSILIGIAAIGLCLYRKK